VSFFLPSRSVLRSLLFALLLIVVALESPDLAAGTTDQSGGPHTWAASSSTGRTLAGTWTVVVDAKTGNVTGTWTVEDADRRAVARGGWSAAKSPKGWNGSWRAAMSGSKVEYSGTWDADTDLKPNASFPDLFKTAVTAAVSGRWRAGGQSGAWSIRVFE
jgi:hypothetical protein